MNRNGGTNRNESGSGSRTPRRHGLTGGKKVLLVTAVAFVALFAILIPTYFSRLRGANFGQKAVYLPFDDVTPPPAVTPEPEETPFAEPSPTPVPEVTPEIQIFHYTDLKLNDDSESVRNLQTRLMELGYLDSDEPGTLYNEATAAAVAMFQRTLNTETDGIASADMQTSLFSDVAVTYEVRNGDSGSDIYAMQSQLTELGYYNGKINGYYGVATEEAVNAFQKKNGLVEDGVFNSGDRDVLYSDEAKPFVDPTPTPKPKKTSRPKKTSSGSGSSGTSSATPKPSSGESYPTGGSFSATGDVAGVISVATAQIGKQYVTGDEGPNTFDCSGLVYYCLRMNGVSVGRRSSASYAENSAWRKIDSMNDVRKGDLLFFKSDSSSQVSHVAIYIGGGKMIDASSSNGKVVRRSATSDYWERNFVCARRVFG
ncbi:MAG: peptidoglycan-binding protein [Clostridia bacterium]|nr:peptidoglycan-binding protein [Clostridia bacterium]